MKSVNKMGVILLPLLAAAGILAGCASNRTVPTADVAAAPEKPATPIDWAGVAIGAQIPKWVEAYRESTVAIQNVAEYAGSYWFVVSIDNESNLDYALAWVNNTANAANEVGRTISTTVTSGSESGLQGVKNEGVESAITEGIIATVNASFNGYRRVADFWVHVRNNYTKSTYYTAYSLWIIDQKNLDQQIIANIQNILSNNDALSPAEQTTYRERIETIRSRGIWAARAN
jgi:hypothetical protein